MRTILSRYRWINFGRALNWTGIQLVDVDDNTIVTRVYIKADGVFIGADLRALPRNNTNTFYGDYLE